MRKMRATRKLKVLLWTLISCFTLVTHSHAQNSADLAKTTGKITDKVSGEPIVGATVSVKGTKNSAATDQNGLFTVIGAPGQTLIISAVGYSKSEIKIGNTGSVTLALEKGFNNLDEVVVIGYGTAKKKDVVGAVDVVDTKEAGATTSTNPSELLIGKSAGVQIVQSSGTPGADAQIFIRGTGSFTGVDPLYIIDGIQGDKNLFNALNTQDILNITILKDAASTAIYGSSGANGVVIITTRKGKPGAPRISFTSQWGVAKAWRQLHLLNAAQYVDLLKDFAANNNTTLPAKFGTASVLVDSNNWQSQIFRPAPVSENDINITGGGEKVVYSLSLGYISQESIVKALTNNRVNVRFSLDETLGRFRFGQSVAIRYTNTIGQMANISDGIQYAPYKPLHDPSVPGGFSIVSNIADFSNVNNPLQAESLNHPVSNEFVLFPQAYGEVSLIKGLKFRSQILAEIGGGKYTNYQYPYTASNNLAQPRVAVLQYNDYSAYTLENYFSYDRTFGKHNIAATLGNSYLSPGSSSGTTVTGANIPNDNVQNISVAQSQTVTGSYVGYDRPSVISEYARLIYSYDKKYILSGSFRRDGASNFGPNNQFGNFYGAGFAWRFSDENFMKAASFLSDGKLRFGWGTTGNNNIPTVGITSVLTFSGTPSGNLVYSLGSNKAFYDGTTIATLANPDIRWESTKQADIGLDLAFLASKLNLTIDLYDRNSSGLLVEVNQPGSTGASLSGGQPVEFANAASAVNKGIELMLGYHDKINRDLTYTIGFNFAYNKNNVTSLGNQFTAPILAGSFQNLGTFTQTAPGSPIGSFYGYKVDHVAKDQAEIDALNAKAPGGVYQSGLKPGDFIFKDINHNGTITDSDQTVLGNPIPKFIYGFNVGLNYKNFDLNLVFSGVAGLKLVDGLKFFTATEATGHNTSTDMLNRWRNPGDVASIPAAGQDATGAANLAPSDWWIEKGDYLRLRNITLGYSLSQQIISGIGNGHVITRMRFYVAAQNLFTVTRYKGYDPEISVLNPSSPDYIFSRGIDGGALPQPRTLLGGVQIGF
jgi:TonB-dependent starch-binding outer membrane protein SusC